MDTQNRLIDSASLVIKKSTTAAINSAKNQKSLDKQPRRIVRFNNGNQQCELNRQFYGISIKPAAFFSFCEKNLYTTSSQQSFYYVFRRCFKTSTNKARNN